ncbi:MAG: AraC family transcriptional regulator, partial [Acidobacteria bacterium]
ASLADIAIEAGFSDQPHFSRAFKQVTGFTPARYRESLLT